MYLPLLCHPNVGSVLIMSWLLQCWQDRLYLQHRSQMFTVTVTLTTVPLSFWQLPMLFCQLPTIILTTILLSFSQLLTVILITFHCHFDVILTTMHCDLDETNPTVPWSYICIRWYTVTSYTVLLICLPAGQCENWWLGPLEDIFGSSLTSAKPSLLRSELETCQELLQLEPENKCEQPSHA